MSLWWMWQYNPEVPQVLTGQYPDTLTVLDNLSIFILEQFELFQSTLEYDTVQDGGFSLSYTVR